jgi:hypothetical protein
MTAQSALEKLSKYWLPVERGFPVTDTPGTGIPDV